MSIWQSVVLPAVSGAGGIGGVGTAVLHFIRGQAESVVNEAVEPIAAAVEDIKTDVAYIKGNLGLPKS